jgi:hypothetical protein
LEWSKRKGIRIGLGMEKGCWYKGKGKESAQATWDWVGKGGWVDRHSAVEKIRSLRIATLFFIKAEKY